MSPFAHREDIASVAPRIEEFMFGRLAEHRDVGAMVTFRAVPGMTAEWMQRVVNCHLARASALGFEMPEMAYRPLMLRGASARVTSTGEGFAVAVRGDDEASAREILHRAQRLTTSATPAH